MAIWSSHTIPAIYHKFKDARIHPVTAIAVFREAAKEISLDQEAEEIVNRLWNMLKYEDAIKISDWTHQKGAPGHEEWENKEGKVHRNNVIAVESIKKYLDTAL